MSAHVLEGGLIIALPIVALSVSLGVAIVRSFHPEISELAGLRKIIFRTGLTGTSLSVLLVFVLISALVVNGHRIKPVNVPWGLMVLVGFIAGAVGAVGGSFGRGLSRVLAMANAGLSIAFWLLLGQVMSF